MTDKSIMINSAEMRDICRDSKYGLTEKRASALPAKTVSVY